MAVNTKAAARALKTLISGLAGIGSVQIGAPTSWDKRVSAFVGMGSQQESRKTAGTTARDGRFFVVFAYRVDGAETSAEETLMDLVDAFIAAVQADLTLGGTCRQLDVDTGMADEPDYAFRAGQEFRQFPIVVTARQYGTYNTNP